MSNETKQTNQPDVDTELSDASQLGDVSKLSDLVSYLDGELPNDQAESFEKQLTTDSVMRSDADILSRTWAMLDSLDEVSGSRQFTQSTLQVVAAETKSQPVTRQVRSFQLLKMLAEHHVLPLFLLGAFCTATGLWIAQSAVDRRPRQREELAVDRIVLQDYDMLQNLELYQRVPNADVLKNLAISLEQNKTQPSAAQDIIQKDSQ